MRTAIPVLLALLTFPTSTTLWRQDPEVWEKVFDSTKITIHSIACTEKGRCVAVGRYDRFTSHQRNCVGPSTDSGATWDEPDYPIVPESRGGTGGTSRPPFSTTPYPSIVSVSSRSTRSTIDGELWRGALTARAPLLIGRLPSIRRVAATAGLPNSIRSCTRRATMRYEPFFRSKRDI